MYSTIVFALFIITLNHNVKSSSLGRMYIKDLDLTKCDNKYQPINVRNIEIEIGEKWSIQISGSLDTSEDLVAPIKASITLKKKVAFFWVKVPCKNNVGSCEFDDLCSYGYPKDKPCPSELIENQIPCRCPIKQGNYTLPPNKYQYPDDRSILTGKYKGNILLTNGQTRLGCYNFQFKLKD